MKSIRSLFAVLISSLAIFTQINAVLQSDQGLRSHWLADPHRNRIELFKKWLENKPNSGGIASSPYDALHPTHQFKGACCYCFVFSRDSDQLSDKTKCSRQSLENIILNIGIEMNFNQKKFRMY